MTITTKRSLIALLLSLVLVVSLFTVGISATEATTGSSEEVTTTVEGTEASSENSSESTSESTTETETDEVVDTTAADAMKKTLIINGIIIAVIVVILVVVFFKFRVKLMEFFRSVKSELKKIVWSSKEQTRKGFLVAIVVTVIFAVGLLIVDFAFKEGFIYLAKLFQ